MADPKVKSTDTKVVDEEGPIAKPASGDADAHYIDPDLSFQEDTGELPDEEKEWHEARDKARDEGVAAAESADEDAVKERRKRAQEEAKEREEALKNQPPIIAPVAPPPAKQTAKS